MDSRPYNAEPVSKIRLNPWYFALQFWIWLGLVGHSDLSWVSMCVRHLWNPPFLSGVQAEKHTLLECQTVQNYSFSYTKLFEIFIKSVHFFTFWSVRLWKITLSDTNSFNRFLWKAYPFSYFRGFRYSNLVKCEMSSSALKKVIFYSIFRTHMVNQEMSECAPPPPHTHALPPGVVGMKIVG